MPDPLPPAPSIFRTIGTVFRQNQTACLVLNVIVITLVTTYYQVPAVASVWEAVGEFKLRWSYAFSLTSTIFAAALMPFCIQALMGTLPAEGRGKRLGHGNDVSTLLKKVALDQFVFSPLWFVPTYLIALRWIDLGANWKLTRASLDREFWTRTCPTVMVTNWLVWIPALALVYSLPAALQFPLFSVVMCFFILIVTLLAGKTEQR
jgi:hypothetical protein